MLATSKIAKKFLLEEKLDLEDLVGEHEVSGVDFDVVSVYSYDESNRMTVVIDGIPLGFIEDPNDGWRSTFGEIQVGNPNVENTFNPVKIDFKYFDGNTLDNYSNYEGIIAFHDNREVLK